MKNVEEIPYWLALTHYLPKWGTEKTNRLIVKVIHDNQIDLAKFFNLSDSNLSKDYGLSEKEVSDVRNAKKELPNLAFLSENLLSEGFEIITLNSPEYSRTLKNNLKAKYSPTILYVKGNKKLLQENSVAIVGSRDASDVSLIFTDNVARLASKEYKVVVSGFAKGVDKHALDSSIKYKGQSIIVLPQGITTFGSGFKKYYSEIINGDVLVLSTFFPKATWNAGLAMARNPIIYGLANEIYVAQSSHKGGTWEGVIDGLKKGRLIRVRYPEVTEENANLILLEKGAIPVDMQGKDLILNSKSILQEQEEKYNLVESPEDKMLNEITKLLLHQILTPKQILEKLKLIITDKELTKKLKTIKNIDTIKKSNKIHYFIKAEHPTLFK